LDYTLNITETTQYIHARGARSPFTIKKKVTQLHAAIALYILTMPQNASELTP
jgi:hypothetical protein